jgi:hypothetical protein
MAVFICFLVGVGVIWMLMCYDQEVKRQKIQSAKEDYDRSIERLRTAPATADLRQRALEYGREYSNLSRDSKGVAIFDEVAIHNDLSAACAATSVAVVSKPQSTRDKLAELQELAHSGLISPTEFESMRAEVLQSFAQAAR